MFPVQFAVALTVRSVSTTGMPNETNSTGACNVKPPRSAVPLATETCCELVCGAAAAGPANAIAATPNTQAKNRTCTLRRTLRDPHKTLRVLPPGFEAWYMLPPPSSCRYGATRRHLMVGRGPPTRFGRIPRSDPWTTRGVCKEVTEV